MRRSLREGEKMPEKNRWVRLDNASNIFLAARNDTDTKVFRLSARVAGPVKPAVLQKALDKTFEQYVLYHSVLRRGIFWYYLEQSELKPKVQLETAPPCAQIYHYDRRELLFRVLYHADRIHLEVFHALSDGTGAMGFFQDLLTEYLSLRYPEVYGNVDSLDSERLQKQMEDSFAHYFRKTRQLNFAEAAQSSLQTVTKVGKKAAHWFKSTYSPVPVGRKKNVYRVRGEKTPDNRMHAIELEMPVKEVLALSRKEKVSLTIYLTALFVEATQQTAPPSATPRTITVSVPVNLRQFFPSRTSRNFFSTTHLAYTYGEKKDTLSHVCQTFQDQLQRQISPDSLETRLNRLISYELNPLARIVIRPLKDVLLKVINYFNNRNTSLAMSNLGRVELPQPVDGYVEQVYFQTAAVRPQFCMIGHGEHLTVTFTSPFVETAIQQRFVRMLTERGVSVTVAANKVTEEELEGKR